MRYLVKVAYDGTAYHGFQRQQNALGIQTVIEKAFRNMTQTAITIHRAGRTDKGVHALGQTLHFDSDLNIDIRTWKRAMNDRLPLDIRILSLKKVAPHFHARHNAVSKVYQYVMAKKPSSVFTKNYEVYIPDFDIELVKQAMHDFEGTHDFKGFCQYVKGKDTIKTIHQVLLKETSKHYVFIFHGNSFLKYMVRSMMGTLIEIGRHRKPIDTIRHILETQDRKAAGKTAEARGLYLVKIHYQ